MSSTGRIRQRGVGELCDELPGRNVMEQLTGGVIEEFNMTGRHDPAHHDRLFQDLKRNEGDTLEKLFSQLTGQTNFDQLADGFTQTFNP